jgi:hypothetical protein
MYGICSPERKTVDPSKIPGLLRNQNTILDEEHIAAGRKESLEERFYIVAHIALGVRAFSDRKCRGQNFDLFIKCSIEKLFKKPKIIFTGGIILSCNL